MIVMIVSDIDSDTDKCLPASARNAPLPPISRLLPSCFYQTTNMPPIPGPISAQELEALSTKAISAKAAAYCKYALFVNVALY